MGGDRTLVHDLHFKIFGDGFTRTFRALMMEGNWRGAFRVVNDRHDCRAPQLRGLNFNR